MNTENIKLLVGLLGTIRALKWNYWNSHWMASGNPYYGDHLLFQRLYQEDNIDNQIDTLAEKITAYEPQVLSDGFMRMAFDRFLNRYEGEPNLFQRALLMEKHCQESLKYVYNQIKESDELSLGLDDFLMATANQRETAIYLLQQRIRRQA